MPSTATVRIGSREVGPGHPCLIVAELGINHVGDPHQAEALIRAAADSGADAIKMQVGDPTEYVNPERWDAPKDTPWGTLRYIDYRKRMEFTDEVYWGLQNLAHSLGMLWFASPLERCAVTRLEAMNVPCHKVASPMVTDEGLLDALRQTGKPVLASTGMSTAAEIRRMIALLSPSPTVLMHCTSAYPCPPEQINLRVLSALRLGFNGHMLGYSGHEEGWAPTIAARALGACVIERHFTLDRSAWGSDQAASLEPHEFRQMVDALRVVEASMGDGEKRVYPTERENMAKFRRAEAEVEPFAEVMAQATVIVAVALATGGAVFGVLQRVL